MAGEGYRMMGQAQRGIAENRRIVDKNRSLLADITSAATFMVGQADKSKTAWGEYEKGYEGVTGGPIDTSRKFGQKGWLTRTFGKPKGDLMVGDTKYQMENIQKAGQFLGGEASTLLEPKKRQEEA